MQRHRTPLIDVLREAHWFHTSRARGYRLILLAVTLGIAALWVITSHHGIDREGKPLGTDFLAFWSASRLAWSGEPTAVYDLGRIYAAERGAVPIDPGLSSFLYPPPFLLVCLPLGLAPYFVSLAAWLVATGVSYGLVIKRWLGGHRSAWLTIFAFPAIVSNIGHGQNGFLTASLLGGGLWLIDRRPWLAGVLLGTLVIKPQIAFAVPILILASWRWRVMLAGIMSATALSIASWFAFGSAAWIAFVSGGATARGILEQGFVEPGKLVSVFAGVQVLHGGIAVGYALQSIVAFGATIMLAVVAYRSDTRPGGAAALCAAATALISPFLLDYDLTLTAIPLAWLFGEGLRRGFLPWEKPILAAAYILPLIARGFALNLDVPIAPIILVALFGAVARGAVHKTLFVSNTSDTRQQRFT